MISPSTAPLKKLKARTFFVPARGERQMANYASVSVAVILPTYRPTKLTERLVRDLVAYNPLLVVYVVDDCTPEEFTESIVILGRLRTLSDRVHLLRTPVNNLKAGALNHGLAHIRGQKNIPDIIVTLDDDVVIESATIQQLVAKLLSAPDLGAVCSLCRAYNKNTNLLTRLQGLEYLGFNAIRLADHGFLWGPLVMHGMLSAFRAKALHDAGEFAVGHLIEDYEITARLKTHGWSVASAPMARAWTEVPERLSEFWRQRTRWSYGGLTVVARIKGVTPVFQDVLGHSMFLSMIALLLVLSFSQDGGYIPPSLAYGVVILSLFQLIVWYIFQLWLMRAYRERDGYDWLLRATLIPEFLYSYIMTAALLGSYLFFVFNSVKAPLDHWFYLRRPLIALDSFFGLCGYTREKWGTRI